MESHRDNPSINDGASLYGAVTLFQPPSQINLRKVTLKRRLNFKKDCFAFSEFMSGRFLSISAALFCFTAFFFTALPAVISLAAMTLFKPSPVTLDSIVMTGDTQAKQVVFGRDMNLLWSALAFSMAAVLSMILYCALSSVNERARGKKINMQQLLERLVLVPNLQSDAASPLIEEAMGLLATIENNISPQIPSDVESENSALVSASFRS